MLHCTTLIILNILRTNMKDGSTTWSCRLTKSGIVLSFYRLCRKRWCEIVNKTCFFYHCSEDFTAYADVCFREFGNHVKFWTTINEGNIFSIGGYNDGDSPPGRCSIPGQNCLLGNSSTEPYIVGHNLLLAHASVSRLYKQNYKVHIVLHNTILECVSWWQENNILNSIYNVQDKQGGSIGFSILTIGFSPSTSSKDDAIATQRANDFFNGWWVKHKLFQKISS